MRSYFCFVHVGVHFCIKTKPAHEQLKNDEFINVYVTFYIYSFVFAIMFDATVLVLIWDITEGCGKQE